MTSKDYIHKEFPKTVDEDDLYGQIKRTVNGKPVPPEQLQMIVDAVIENISPKKSDNLLDLCCGNGALASVTHKDVNSYLGVDFSEYLIEIAKKKFEEPPKIQFQLSDALGYTQSEANPEKFNKCLCYGAFQYLPENAAETTLKNLYEKFKNLELIFIGNLADRDCADKFFYDHIDYTNLLDDNTAPLGKWYGMQEFEDIFSKTGWQVKTKRMPKEYYAEYYRFDAVLTRD